ncbi:hypothetical protein F4802DRAFT_292726 [Xylaria palmicola]|nr:hypothetical protein F4802DRAFT_292726 [Xylaria palmicola]
MATKKQQRLATRCTENIAMLHLLHEVPAPPSSNDLTRFQNRDAQFSLPFTVEERLAGVFAFLAKLEDGPDHIPAVCLQETPENHRMNVLVAVNQGSCNDGKSYLADIKESFERILGALSSPEDHSQDIEGTVFKIIVELYQERILCRLRLKKKKRDAPDKKRISIADGLHKVVDSLSREASEGTASFLDRARAVIKLTTSWKNHQTIPKLEELIKGINALRQTDKFEEILSGSMPDVYDNANVGAHLSNMIRKVARYPESARILRRAAREFPLVRTMRVIVVELPSNAFNRPAISQEYQPTLSSVISRLPSLKKAQKNVNQLCSVLAISAKKANDQYASQVRDSLKKSRIHAEIQLLYYCQMGLNRKTHLPRVVRSSKSACWLCNSFILLYGNVGTPRSHGRLYPGWRLPSLPGTWCNDIATKFNLRLEQVLIESLRILFVKKTKISYLGPIESEVSTITWLSNHVKSIDSNSVDDTSGRSESDLSTVTWSSAKSEGSNHPDHVLGGEGLERLSPVVVHNAPKPSELATTNQEVPTPERQIPAEDTALCVSGSYNNPLPGSSVVPMASGLLSQACASLVNTSQERHDETRTYKIILGEVSPVHHLESLQLQFEYAGSPRQQTLSDGHLKQLICTVEWLPREAFQRLKLEGDTVVEVECLTGEEVSQSMDTTNSIYLSLGGAVLKVRMQPTV